MNRLALPFLLMLLFVPSLCYAMGTEEKGNRPLSELNYSDWKGIMPIVNAKSRVYQVWINGNEYLCYKGKTKELNEALASFAKVEVENHVVVLRPGAADRRAFDKTLVPLNWEIHLLGGLAKSKATDGIENLDWQRDPVLTIYVTDEIDLDVIEIPKGVTLRSAPALHPDAKTNDETHSQIAKFIEHHQRDAKE
jgi:hypothetical protein